MKRILSILGCLACIAVSAQPSYTLEQILDSARVNNVSIRGARYDIEAAAQQRKEAFTKYFPEVSATGLWFNSNKPMAQVDINLADKITPEMGQMLAQILPPEALAALGTPLSMSMLKNGTVAGVMATQPVFAGGRIVNGNKLAKLGEEVSELKYELSQNEVERTAEQYFWQIISLQEKMNTLNAVDTLLSDICKDVKVAVDAGVAMRNDLLQVQLRQNDIASQKLKVNNGLGLVKLLLAQYCGLKDEFFSLVSCDDAAPALIARQNHEEALYGTAEYKLLGKQVEAASLQRKIEVGKYLPTVAVGAGYNYHNLLDNDHHFGMIFATVNIPISGWWGGSHAIKRKSIEYQKAKDQLDDKSALLRIRMQNAWNSVEEAWEQLLLTDRSIEQAKENLRLNVDYYHAGLSKMSDLLEAQLLYQQAMDRRTDASANYHNQVTLYRQATGQ